MDALKVVSFLNRRADYSLPAFSEYWRTIHRGHAMKLVEAGFMQGYVQNHGVAAGLEGLPVMADGSPELWIDGLDTLERLIASREYQEGAGPDEANFVTPPVLACVAHERIIQEAAEPAALQGALKLILVVSRAPQANAADFRERWLSGDGGPLLAGQPLRLTRQAVVEGDAPAVFDGVECSWWPDLETLRRAWRQRDPAAGRGLIAADSLRGLLARAEVVVQPPQSAGG
ncbi:EthD domain-containing protein [Pseudomonas linyingensis]|uniref:EthD domain-containing protein n=1 Tax=Pseudomonas linyingensis TaxID=915471 RepID=A0A1H7BGD0_9PSED|nr:EthD domain-containing protein [Pseudomonas linyingensis]SEJ76679.1 EthD domain-containing protein [Pseudomonas linyingensis]